MLRGIWHTDFLVYEAVACYQIAIRCIIRVVGDKRRHPIVPPDHTWHFIRHQFSQFFYWHIKILQQREDDSSIRKRSSWHTASHEELLTRGLK
jgi:hypothetical protein